jgi:AraC-like DNA-binding protein
MDEIEGGVLAQIPPASLSLTLTRSTIKMQHSANWSIDKVNPVDDLLIGLEGHGDYLIEGAHLRLGPGEALLIRRGQRFIGSNPTSTPYTGIAQHFTLDMHGSIDLLGQIVLRPKVRLSRWEVLEPLVRQYRQSAPPSSVTLMQHHMFMVILLAYIDDAFEAWRDQRSFSAIRPDTLDLSIMVAASRIAASPLDDGIAERVVAEAPYNPDYFHRAFQKRIGRTPRKFQDFKRIERAMHLLETGVGVALAGAEVGYGDPYYFSRVFKRTVGISPRTYLRRLEQSRDGSLMQLDELDQLDRLRQAGLE